MNGKTLEELKQIQTERYNEQSRIDLSINLRLYPTCGKDLIYKCRFWGDKSICSCGFEHSVFTPGDGCE